MKSIAKITAIVFLLTLSIAVPVVMADKYRERAGKSNTAHLYLYEKDPSDWSIVDGGAWGKMKFNKAGSTFDFVFNGHYLEPNTDYTLIYYADPWGADPQGLFIGEGISTSDGDIHIADSIDLGNDLPMDHDENEGAKVWIVLSSHIDVEDGTISFKAWDATEYLFEHNLITFDDTD